ncbi:hypothetical protein QTP88_010184 [Uroleucon formosanum]
MSNTTLFKCSLRNGSNFANNFIIPKSLGISKIPRELPNISLSPKNLNHFDL